MALVDLIEPWIPTGGLALMLLIMAYHGWEIVELLTKFGMYAKVGIGMLVLLAAGIALGVIRGFDVARLLELGGTGRVVPAGAGANLGGLAHVG